tara:strand:+ start:156 stop:371 length:216 start_codon:yes stop_codon:yes gene_type:complete
MAKCPACGTGTHDGRSLNVRCDSCGVGFCRDGNCPGHPKPAKMAMIGSGRPENGICKACGKGKLIKIQGRN